MAYRHRRQPGLRHTLGRFRAARWRVTETPTFYRALCPCGDHQRWIAATPTHADVYAVDLLVWLRSQTCYQESGSW